MSHQFFTLAVSIVMGATLLCLGLVIKPDWLSDLALISGGMFFGHALTELLNTP